MIRRAKLFAAVALLLISITGCAWADSTGIDYSGKYYREVGACASPAMAGQLRDDSVVASRIWVQNVDVVVLESTPTYKLRVTGETEVHAGGVRIYSWTCETELDATSRRLTAELTAFELTRAPQS